tara:strand:- start:1172 stop:3304 length:2133 start_codon:yes stop_codon:yes gene_type:complete
MRANGIAVNETLRGVSFGVEAFDPWRTSWDSVVNFYRSFGIDVSGLSSSDPAKHRIEIPETYFRSGTAPSQRIISFGQVNRPNVIAPNDKRLVAIKRRVLRILAILILHKKTSLRPRKNSKSNYGWRTFATEARALFEVARVALIEGRVGDQGSCPDGPIVFSQLTKSDLLSHAKYQNEIYRVHSSLVIAKQKSLIDDWFNFDLDEWSYENSKKRKSNKKGRSEKPRGQNEFEPFEDYDLGKMLETCSLLSDLTDDLIAIDRHAKGLLLIPTNYRAKELRKFLLSYQGKHLKQGSLPFLWKGKAGKLISQIGEHSSPLSFVRSLMFQVQAAHMQLLNFLMMLRAWETEHLPFDAVRKHRGTGLHIMTAKFAKMAFGTSGDQRDWPLSPLAVRTIERQHALKLALADVVDRPKYLFSNDELANDFRYSRFWNYIRDPKGRRLIKEQSIVPTRYRASACRLVVLAEFGGDNIARQMMGHQDLATTMGYANANGRLASEMLATRARVQQVMGKRLLDDYRGGRLPKRSLEEVSARLASIQDHVGEGIDLPDGLVPSAIRQLGTSEVEDIESMLGEGLRMTAPGVFCNRRNDQVGACRNTVRVVNPGRCNENKSCMYRLEAGDYLLNQAERIESYLGMLAHKKPYDPRDFGFYHIVVALLDCFYEIHREVEEKAHDPRVHEVLDAIDEEMFEELLTDAQRAFGAIQEIRAGEAA